MKCVGSWSYLAVKGFGINLLHEKLMMGKSTPTEHSRKSG